jgi:hypothetical protein
LFLALGLSELFLATALLLGISKIKIILWLQYNSMSYIWRFIESDTKTYICSKAQWITDL